VANVMLVSG